MYNGTLYQLPLDGKASVVFTPPVDISSVVFRKPSLLTFIASVHPNTTLAESRELKQAAKCRRDSAQVYTNLWVRHWDKWMTLEKPSLFAVQIVRKEDKWLVGTEINLLQDMPLCEDPLVRWSVEKYAVDPQGRQAAFVVRRPGHDMAWSTDVDIYRTPTNASHPQLLTGNVNGTASSPAFSDDGRYLAWLQMETPGYEADINRIYFHDQSTGKTTSIARDWDLSPQSLLLWSVNGTHLFVVVADRGDTAVYSIAINSGNCLRLTGQGSASVIKRAGNKLALLFSDQDKCSDVHILNPDTHKMQQLTNINHDALQNVYLGPAEDFWFTGAHGDRVHGWLTKPRAFDPKNKYPLALIIHGGPQQANSHAFSYSQWNPNMYASAGFVVVQINFHGSPGYGQNFTDSIQNHWGSYPLEDLMVGLDYLLTNNTFIDSARMIAMGASFGGYMVNWINANSRRFNALVAHDGMFSVPMFWYTTDELWFPEHEFGGLPYDLAARPNYNQIDPEHFAANFSTPTLFIHGANDFRLPVEQSLAPFTLLRRKGIAAKLVYFPDENHWTSSTGNSIRWYTEVLSWIAHFTNTTLPYELPN
ncbi:alpha/beta-hydrolase [Coemansia reversa NRRL 1564]|uniref:Dipeptidyl-peptidase V n=1 Tax=Coemansia reversa (strain ATCC 12441 / NRRL 1564) TaxID=763665 RepID=A0A2G5B2I1_COERN|nr:alpha/beta-hydrolase [Coemansia reversa NRRL 1564]|eukprot:PIA13220.1 alpha/beta-hydrolase [Coemansia reversa NRRL 1564]